MSKEETLLSSLAQKDNILGHSLARCQSHESNVALLRDLAQALIPGSELLNGGYKCDILATGVSPRLLGVLQKGGHTLCRPSVVGRGSFQNCSW
jgi:hypothetical protein